MSPSLGLRSYLSPLTALVGAGGKTTIMFSLGRELAARGKAILVTTTTHLRDHRLDFPLPYDRILIRHGTLTGLGEDVQPGLSLLVSGSLVDSKDGLSRLRGLDPGCFPQLLSLFSTILVEADGARGLPIKVPASHEPVLPAGVGSVLGVIGLDCLGRLVLPGQVHRPEGFRALGIEASTPIGLEALRILVGHPQGLFKDCPPGVRRIVILNKADLAPRGLALDLAQSLADLPGIEAVALTSQQLGPASLLSGAEVYSRLPKESTP